MKNLMVTIVNMFNYRGSDNQVERTNIIDISNQEKEKINSACYPHVRNWFLGYQIAIEFERRQCWISFLFSSESRSYNNKSKSG